MAQVTHKIKENLYRYEHTRVGKKVVCKYLGKVGGGGRTHRATSSSTRLANSPYTASYDSQTDLDTEVRKAYQQGYGVKRIQGMFEELDLHPTRRAVENYLTQDLNLELRRRAPKSAPHNTPNYEEELVQTKQAIEIMQDEQDGKDIQLHQLKTAKMEDAAKIAELKAKLRDYRDMGRAPTVKEIEAIYDKQ